jgi:hypothetical protein
MSDETDTGDDAADDASTGETGTEIDDDGGPRAELQKTKERLEAEADRAVSEFDEGIVDLLAWLLDTETRARIYVYLRQHPPEHERRNRRRNRIVSEHRPRGAG